MSERRADRRQKHPGRGGLTRGGGERVGRHRDRAKLPQRRPRQRAGPCCDYRTRRYSPSGVRQTTLSATAPLRRLELRRGRIAMARSLRLAANPEELRGCDPQTAPRPRLQAQLPPRRPRRLASADGARGRRLRRCLRRRRGARAGASSSVGRSGHLCRHRGCHRSQTRPGRRPQPPRRRYHRRLFGRRSISSTS